MFGIDTNIVVRLLVVDDREQSRRARDLIAQAVRRSEAVSVSLMVLVETEWVLRSIYGFDKHGTIAAFVSLLETRELAFEDEAAIEEALYNWKKHACGFVDCLIVAHNRRAGCAATLTFDKHAARLPGARAA